MQRLFKKKMNSQIFKDIKKLVINAEFCIENNNTIKTEATVEQKGSDLIIGDPSEGMSIFNIGNSFSRHSNSFGGHSTVQLGNVRLIQNGKTIELKGPPNTPLIVNGVRTTFSNVRGTEPPPPPKETVRYVLDSECCIQTVEHYDNKKTVLPVRFLAKRFIVTLSGCGRVALPSCEFDSLALTVTGSGGICGDKTSAKSVVFAITGSGSISGVEITETGSAVVTGSGDIDATAIHHHSVSKSVTGSGTINIRPTKRQRHSDDDTEQRRK